MRKTLLTVLVLCAGLGSVAPLAQAKKNKAPVETPACPSVADAQKVRDDAAAALQAAKDKKDQAAIDAAQKALDDAESKLTAAVKASDAANRHEKKKKKKDA